MAEGGSMRKRATHARLPDQRRARVEAGGCDPAPQADRYIRVSATGKGGNVASHAMPNGNGGNVLLRWLDKHSQSPNSDSQISVVSERSTSSTSSTRSGSDTVAVYQRESLDRITPSDMATTPGACFRRCRSCSGSCLLPIDQVPAFRTRPYINTGM